MNYVKKYWTDVLIGILIIPQFVAFIIYSWTGFDFGLNAERIDLLITLAIIGILSWVFRAYARLF